MANLTTWQQDLPATLAAFSKLSLPTSDADQTYGLLAAALLWPVRDALVDDDAREALRQVCGPHTRTILQAMQTWGTDQRAAALDLTRQAGTDPDLRAAIDAVVQYFQDTLRTQLQPTPVPPPGPSHIEASNIAGGIVNLGGGQYFYGNVTVTQYQSATPALSPQERRNRARMLARVHGEVERRLQDSLQGAALMALGLENRPEAVPDRWGSLVQEHGQAEPKPLTARAIAEVFDTFDGELLILGTPGAGKTTTLLDLARVLIARAEQDEGLPMPIPFHLSSWAAKRLPFADWLVDELADKYDVPRKVARTWVDGEQILPLLDGLDEVVVEQRAACVEAINAFCASREQGLANLVVCCRLAEYEALTAQLRLRGAVLLQPLSESQIDAYLGGAGDQLTGLRSALRNDPALQELAQTPLLLNLMTLTYEDAPVKALPTDGALEERRTQLLTGYVERMFVRKGASERYPQEPTIRWLAWLARALTQQAQTILYVEHLQPDWLSTHRARCHYTLVDRLGWGVLLGLVSGLVSGLTVGLISGLAYGLVSGLAFGLAYGLAGGLGVGLGVGLFGGKSDIHTRRGARQRGRDLVNAGEGLGLGLAAGLAGGLVSALVFGLPAGLVRGLIRGLFLGLALGLLSKQSGGLGLGPRWIAPVETVRWSLSKARRFALVGLGLGLSLGLAVGLVAGLTGGLAAGLAAEPFARAVIRPAAGLVEGLAGGLVYGLPAGLLFGVLGGLVGDQIEVRTSPNQGIRRSARRAILLGSATILVVGPAAGLVSGLAGGLVSALVFGLPAGLIFGLLVALPNGGYACLSHLALRFVLWREGAIPLNYVRFLEYATERIFLRRVGGGYIFVHRLVQEHFATYEQELIARVCRDGNDQWLEKGTKSTEPGPISYAG